MPFLLSNTVSIDNLSSQRRLSQLNSHNTLVIQSPLRMKNEEFGENRIFDADVLKAILTRMVLNHGTGSLNEAGAIRRTLERGDALAGGASTDTDHVLAVHLEAFDDPLTKLIKDTIASDEGYNYLKNNLNLEIGVRDPVKVGKAESASHFDTYKWWYIGGGTALAIGITAAVVMRNRD